MKKRFGAIILVAAMLFAMLAMPAAAVSVKSFTDVKEGDWFYNYVDYVAKKGFFIGTSETTFEPESAMTRAMFVTVLARVEKAKVDDSTSTFPDVPANEWYTGSVTWATKNKIVEGYEDGTFRPDRAITREEMCALMDRYVGWHAKKNGVTHKTVKNPATFSDFDTASAYAKTYITACAKRGLIEGFEDGTFRPKETSTRAQVATVIYRLDWYVNGGGGGGGYIPPTPFTPVISYAWATPDTTVKDNKAEKEQAAGDDIIDRAIGAANDEIDNAEAYTFNSGKTAEQIAEEYGLKVDIENITRDGTDIYVKGSAELDGDLLDKLVNTIVYYAYRLVNLDTRASEFAGEEDVFTYTEVRATVHDVIETLGVSMKEKDVDKIADQVRARLKAEVKEHGKTAWYKFYLEGQPNADQVLITGNEAQVTIGVGDKPVLNGVEYADKAAFKDEMKSAAKALAKDLAKQAKASIEDITEATDHITYDDWDVKLTVKLVNVPYEYTTTTTTVNKYIRTETQEVGEPIVTEVTEGVVPADGDKYAEGIAAGMEVKTEVTKVDSNDNGNPEYTVHFQADLNSNGTLFYNYNTDSSAYCLTLHIPSEDIEEIVETAKEIMDKKAPSAISKVNDKIIGDENHLTRVSLQAIIEDVKAGNSTFEELSNWLKKNMNLDLVEEVKKASGVDISADSDLMDAALALAIDYVADKARAESESTGKNDFTNEDTFAVEYAKKLTLGSAGKMLESDFIMDKIPTKYDKKVKRLTDYLSYIPDSAVVTVQGKEITEETLAKLRDAKSTAEAVKAIAKLFEGKLRDMTLEDFLGDGEIVKAEWNGFEVSFQLVLVRD